MQLPFANETVMAGVALQIETQKNLRRVLRGLHGGRLAGANCAAPVHTDQEPGWIRRRCWIDQFRHELVIRQVGLQRAAEPFRKTLPGSRFRVVRDSFVIA